MSERRFTGSYPPDWKAVSAAAYKAVGHRCIRCGHPYVKGLWGNGAESPCDDKCHHGGPTKELSPGVVVAEWRILTCHHFDGKKDNCAWWNLLCLCQRCHLQIQGRVDPETPFFLEHSDWIKPYVAGFYAQKYLGLSLTREEVEERTEELLALECRLTLKKAEAE